MKSKSPLRRVSARNLRALRALIREAEDWVTNRPYTPAPRFEDIATSRFCREYLCSTITYRATERARRRAARHASKGTA